MHVGFFKILRQHLLNHQGQRQEEIWIDLKNRLTRAIDNLEQEIDSILQVSNNGNAALMLKNKISLAADIFMAVAFFIDAQATVTKGNTFEGDSDLLHFFISEHIDANYWQRDTGFIECVQRIVALNSENK